MDDKIPNTEIRNYAYEMTSKFYDMRNLCSKSVVREIAYGNCHINSPAGEMVERIVRLLVEMNDSNRL